MRLNGLKLEIETRVRVADVHPPKRAYLDTIRIDRYFCALPSMARFASVVTGVMAVSIDRTYSD